MSTIELRQEVEAIEHFGWNIENTTSYLGLNLATLKDMLYRKNRSVIQNPNSKNYSIVYFRVFLEKISERGCYPTRDVVDSIPVMGERSFSSFIKESLGKKDPETIIYIIKVSVEKYTSNRLSLDYISLFKKNFGGEINDKTLTKAAIENPQFLADFITQGKIKNFTRAIAVSKLGLAVNDNYLGLLKSLTRDPSPLVREGAYKALTEYFTENEEKYSDLYNFFKEGFEKETGDGVKKQISSLMDIMDMYK